MLGLGKFCLCLLVNELSSSLSLLVYTQLLKIRVQTRYRVCKPAHGYKVQFKYIKYYMFICIKIYLYRIEIGFSKFITKFII